MKLLIELRAAEGGDDAKLLVPELAGMYIRYAERAGASVDVAEEARGHL